MQNRTFFPLLHRKVEWKLGYCAHLPVKASWSTSHFLMDMFSCMLFNCQNICKMISTVNVFPFCRVYFITSFFFASQISLVQNELLRFNTPIDLEFENLMFVDVQNQYTLIYFASSKVAVPFRLWQNGQNKNSYLEHLALNNVSFSSVVLVFK